MDKGDIIRWIIVFLFGWSFFIITYLTIMPDERLLYLPPIGFVMLIPFIYFLDKLYRVSAFETMELRADKRELFILLGLAIFSFLVFDFLYLTMEQFQFSANFYVGLTLFYMVYGAIAYSGGPSLKMYRNIEREVIFGLLLSATIATFSVITAIVGIIVIPLPVATIALPTTLYVVIILLWAVLGAIVEELAFRAALAPILAERAGIAISATIVSITFVIFHYLTYGLDPIALAYLFVMSMLLTIVSLYTKSLLPALIAHVLNNVLAVLTIIHPLLGLAALSVIIAPFLKVNVREEG